ncbi:hypothetical protein GCM10017608_14240 [Agromyces luteolus]|uniref:Uncharacterized protein n=1 Tax=Agromyces luteolus TaxID=88373 RepID=A0A7C9HM10_9MICO|nr:hypothetical protein [Agromyces luteolus]MUN07722.1 hypothetical protein [Agromyces luteolus]GLK27490.1 hypothetical protein GCM10017608_14240 [Agromyces luteolus]
MDKATLNRRAGTVGGIYGVIGAVILTLGAIAAVIGFIQALIIADDVLVGILAGLFSALVIAVSAVVSWAGVQMFALVARYIEWRSGDGA